MRQFYLKSDFLNIFIRYTVKTLYTDTPYSSKVLYNVGSFCINVTMKCTCLA